MNDIQMNNIIAVFKKVGFPNLRKPSLKLLADHYTSSDNKLIMVMSHTCMSDFLLGLLLFKETAIPAVMFTGFNNPILAHFSKHIGMITHKKGVSNTQNIIQTLQTRQEFGLLVSLGRTKRNSKIRSGYFHVAQALQVPIIVLGFDYFLQNGYVSVKKWLPKIGETYKEFQLTSEKEILREIQNIYPRKPHFQPGFDELKYHSVVNSLPPQPDEFTLYTEVAWRHFQKEFILAIGACALILLLLLFLCIVVFVRKRK